jgi:cell division protein FtsA
LEVEMHVAVAQRGFLDTVRSCVTEAGLKVAGLVLGSAAAGEAVTTTAEREVGIAVLDIGGGTSDLVVYGDGHIQHSAALPAGGGHVSYDLAWGLNTPYPEAEKLKLTAACAMPSLVRNGDQVPLTLADGTSHTWPRSRIAEIVEARMEEILDLARQEIETSVPPGKLMGGLALTGGGSQLPGTVELASRVVGLRAHLGLPTRLAGRTEQVYSPLYATSVGLIRCGAQDQQKQEQLRRQRSLWGRARNWWERCGPSWLQSRNGTSE